jgi:hypothetical protein
MSLEDFIGAHQYMEEERECRVKQAYVRFAAPDGPVLINYNFQMHVK